MLNIRQVDGGTDRELKQHHWVEPLRRFESMVFRALPDCSKFDSQPARLDQ